MAGTRTVFRPAGAESRPSSPPSIGHALARDDPGGNGPGEVASLGPPWANGRGPAAAVREFPLEFSLRV